MAGFTLCYKIPNALDEGYEIKIFDSFVLPMLQYEIVLDDLNYIIERVEVRRVGGRTVYFALLTRFNQDSFVDESMIRQLAETLLQQSAPQP